MSRPYKFVVPKKVLSNIQVQDYITEHNITLYKGRWIYPHIEYRQFIDIDWFLDNQDWLAEHNLIAKPESNEDEYNRLRYMMVNANWIYKYVAEYLKSNYGVENYSLSMGAENGLTTSNLFWDSKTDRIYYYTLDNFKRGSSIHKQEFGRSFRVIIQYIQRSELEIYGVQNDYEFYISQYPTGLKFDFLDYKTKKKYQNEWMNDLDSTDSWPFKKVWWRRYKYNEI